MAQFTVVNEAQRVVGPGVVPPTVVQNLGSGDAYFLFGAGGSAVTSSTGLKLASGGNITVQKEMWLIASGSGVSCDVRTSLT